MTLVMVFPPPPLQAIHLSHPSVITVDNQAFYASCSPIFIRRLHFAVFTANQDFFKEEAVSGPLKQFISVAWNGKEETYFDA